MTAEACKEFMDLIYKIKKQNESEEKVSLETLKEKFLNEEITLEEFMKEIKEQLTLTYNQQFLLNEKLVLIASTVIEELKEQ